MEATFPITDADAIPSFGLLFYFSAVADAVTEAVCLTEIPTADADATTTEESATSLAVTTAVPH